MVRSVSPVASTMLARRGVAGSPVACSHMSAIPSALAAGCDRRPRPGRRPYGAMFWLMWKRLPGSYVRLNSNEAVVVLAVVVLDLVVVVILHEVDVAAGLRVRAERLVVVAYPLMRSASLSGQSKMRGRPCRTWRPGKQRRCRWGRRGGRRR